MLLVSGSVAASSTPGTERPKLFTIAKMHVQHIHIYRRPSDGEERWRHPRALGPWGKEREEESAFTQKPSPFPRMPEVPTRTSGHAYVGPRDLKDAVSMHRRPRTGGLREGRRP